MSVKNDSVHWLVFHTSSEGRRKESSFDDESVAEQFLKEKLRDGKRASMYKVSITSNMKGVY